jgi:hypothetical protein
VLQAKRPLALSEAFDQFTNPLDRVCSVVDHYEGGQTGLPRAPVRSVGAFVEESRVPPPTPLSEYRFEREATFAYPARPEYDLPHEPLTGVAKEVVNFGKLVIAT